MKPVILFAGQGSQAPGMGKEFYEKYEAFRKVFDLLTEEQRQIAFEGPMESLSDTRNTQPIMVAFGAGVYAILNEMGFKPEMAAGLSLGEYTALHAAGVFTAKEAIELVTLRANAMHKASEGIECGMSAVLGLDREILAECCKEVVKTGKGLVQIANYNCPGQIVIAGDKNAVCEAARLAMEKGGKRCMPLPVSGPFHTEFMASAGETLALKFAETNFGEMEFPVVFNTLGRTKCEDENIGDLLVRQVQSSVYFEDSLRYMESNGADLFIEIGPGKALTGFVKKTCKDAETLTINTPCDIEKLGERLNL